jgi:hypothetical protein
MGATGGVVRVQAVRGKLEDCFARLDASGAEPELLALCKKCLAFEPSDRPKRRLFAKERKSAIERLFNADAGHLLCAGALGTAGSDLASALRASSSCLRPQSGDQPGNRRSLGPHRHTHDQAHRQHDFQDGIGHHTQRNQPWPAPCRRALSVPLTQGPAPTVETGFLQAATGTKGTH